MNAEYIVFQVIYLLKGAVTTFTVWIITVSCSIPLGIFVAYLRTKNIRILNAVLGISLSATRGTPLLFQLMLVYFGVPLLFKVQLSPFAASSIAFVNSWTAYLSEIFRGGIDSIDKGQYEAGQALGLERGQIMRYVILPQVLAATLPAVANQSIEAIWATSLLSTIGLNDILKSARVLLMRNFTVTPLLLTGMLYFAFNSLVVLIFKKAEIRLTRYRRDIR